MTIQHNLDAFPGWQGRLQLAYEFDRAKTRLVSNQGIAPLKVQRSFYPEAETICHNTILHTAGGVVGGDGLQIEVNLGRQARAAITTAAATKIYGGNDRIAVQSIVQNIGVDACLEWLPQETIVFDQAIFHQRLRVNLAATGSWLGWEISRFGRTARGERFTQGEWKSATEVYRDGRPIWIDRQILSGDQLVDHPHSLAGHAVVGSLAWIGAVASRELVSEARSIFDGEPSKIGVTRLTEGLLCRYRGDSTTEVRQWFTAVWHLLRYSFLDSPPIHLRVWP